jgi:ureidoacrylate peracid hydrolase
LVEHVLARVTDGRAPAGPAAAVATRPAPGARRRSALLVVDLQNDYCAPDGCFHRLGLVDPARAGQVGDVARRLVAGARVADAPVFFVRTVQGETVPETVRARNRAQGRAECVRPGSWGAEPFGPPSRTGEPVIVKHGYDAFLNTTLERDLRRRGIDRVVLTGVFTDVCVDALARTAYQLGFEVAVVREGTLPLERDQAECLGALERFYGACILDAEAASRLLAAADSEVRPAPESASAAT